MKTFTKQLTKLHLEQEGQKYKVLTQGDMHFKNMLYRNDGTKDEDLILVQIGFRISLMDFMIIFTIHTFRLTTSLAFGPHLL